MGGIAGLQHHINANVGGYFQLHVSALESLEAAFADGDLVDPRLQVGRHVLTRAIRFQAPRNAALHIRDLHRGTDDHRIARVANIAQDSTRGRLREERTGQ